MSKTILAVDDSPSIRQMLVKKLRNIHNDTIFSREKDYGSRLKKTRIGGEVELFG